MASTEQNIKNHARIVPMYHVAAFFPLLLNFGWSIYAVSHDFSADRLVQFVTAFGLLCLMLSLRQQVLTVQDRVIRNEMRQRLARVLPTELQTPAARLSHKQLVALRFASDAELPALVNQVLAGQLTSQKEIKMQIQDWQADFLRA